MSGDHRELHVLTPSFPTRRAADRAEGVCRRAGAERKGLEVRVRNAEGLQHQIGVDPRAGARPVKRDALALDVGHGLDPGVRARHEMDGFRIEVGDDRSEEHTYELQSLMRISYAVFCLKKTK